MKNAANWTYGPLAFLEGWHHCQQRSPASVSWQRPCMSSSVGASNGIWVIWSPEVAVRGVQDKKRQRDCSGLQSSAQSTSIANNSFWELQGLPSSFGPWYDSGHCRGTLIHTTYGCLSWAEVINCESIPPPDSFWNIARNPLRHLLWKIPRKRCLHSPVSCLLRAASLSSSRVTSHVDLSQSCLWDFLQEAKLMLTTGSTRLAVSRGQQTWYHSTCYI